MAQFVPEWRPGSCCIGHWTRTSVGAMQTSRCAPGRCLPRSKVDGIAARVDACLQSIEHRYHSAIRLSPVLVIAFSIVTAFYDAVRGRSRLNICV